MITVDQRLALTLRYLRMREGIVAVWGNKIWTVTKPTSNKPIVINSAIIRPSRHWRMSVQLMVDIPGVSNLQHTSGHPTEAPRGDRLHPVPEVRSQKRRVITSSSSREAWLYLSQEPSGSRKWRPTPRHRKVG